MGVERYTQIINSSGRAELARGNFFLFLTASAAVNVRADRDGSSEGFNNIVGGILIERVRPWDQMIIVGAAGTSIEYIVGSENVQVDRTDIRLGVSVIAGTVAVNIAPSGAVVENLPVVVADTTEAVLIAANPLRRRLRVAADSLNAGSVFIRRQAGGAFVDELQGGVSKQFDTLQGLWVQNDTGADATLYLFEEV